jgi:hypothetical protein
MNASGLDGRPLYAFVSMYCSPESCEKWDAYEKSRARPKIGESRPHLALELPPAMEVPTVWN